jgi:D-alanyl-D-alanine dipeptidase
MFIGKLLLFLFLSAFTTALYPLDKPWINDAVIRQENLVNIQALDPAIGVKLMYATTNNFLGKNVYGDLKICYLRREAAEKLTNAQRILRDKLPGYSLLVYDGLRPRRVQYQMWDIVKGTPRMFYVGNPKFGSIHNYGAAVDLTIMDEKGAPLDMGTSFDYFGLKAQPRYEDYYLHPELLEKAKLDENVREMIESDIKSAGPLTGMEITNRLLLRNIMEQAGFEPIVNEWWHFNAFPNDVVRKKFKIIE